MARKKSRKDGAGTAAGSAAKDVRFELAAPVGSEVFVAGSFNNWAPQEHRLRDNPREGHFTGTIALPPGRHAYKFVVNGAWCPDPSCTESVADGYGSVNSIIEV